MINLIIGGRVSFLASGVVLGQRVMEWRRVTTEVWSVDAGAVTIRFPFCRLFVATEDGRFGTDLRERREGVLGGGGGGRGGLDGGGVRAGVVGGRAGQTAPGVGVVVATPKSLESHLHLLHLEDNRGGSL